MAEGSYLSTDELESSLRFGAEWTFSSQEMLDSFPKDGNQVRVETPFSRQKIENLKNHLEKSRAKRGAKEKIEISGKNFHSHWNRQVSRH